MRYYQSWAEDAWKAVYKHPPSRVIRFCIAVDTLVYEVVGHLLRWRPIRKGRSYGSLY